MMGHDDGVPLRSYLIEDDGDALQVHFIFSGEKVGGAFFLLDALGEVGTFDLAITLGVAYVKDQGGMGGSILPI